MFECQFCRQRALDLCGVNGPVSLIEEVLCVYLHHGFGQRCGQFRSESTGALTHIKAGAGMAHHSDEQGQWRHGG